LTLWRGSLVSAPAPGRRSSQRNWSRKKKLKGQLIRERERAFLEKEIYSAKKKRCVEKKKRLKKENKKASTAKGNSLRKKRVGELAIDRKKEGKAEYCFDGNRKRKKKKIRGGKIFQGSVGQISAINSGKSGSLSSRTGGKGGVTRRREGGEKERAGKGVGVLTQRKRGKSCLLGGASQPGGKEGGGISCKKSSKKEGEGKKNVFSLIWKGKKRQAGAAKNGRLLLRGERMNTSGAIVPERGKGKGNQQARKETEASLT